MHENDIEEFEGVDVAPPTPKELITPGNCYICGTKRVKGRCPAYHPNDTDHILNRNLIKNGIPPIPVEPVSLDKTDWGPCWQCGARTDADGRCTRINAFSHSIAYNPWMDAFHSQHEMETAPPAAFLIEGFLQQDGITALAAPVAQRKSLIALNVAHALCTGEPLFNYFKVTRKPERVIYLCPEMSLRSFTDRLKKIGLLSYVGETLFCRTMSASGKLELSDLTPDALEGAAVIIDTAVRYLKGDENSSEHMRAFADEIFRVMRDGALSVLLLHHSAKGTKESSELSLENAMRGSGELGAFVSACWATRLQHPDDPYTSASYLVNVKQRDFESKPFEATCSANCRMTIVETPGDNVKLNSKSVGSQANADGNEEAALQVIRDNPTLSIRDLAAVLKKVGIKRSKSWVGDKRYELFNQGIKTSS